MRPDLGKCVIESPRRGSSAPSAKVRYYGKITVDDEGYDYDGIGSRLPSTRKQEGYNKRIGSKSFTDKLGPLYGYLTANCGRPWDDVYSELARGLGRSGSEGIRHILSDHLNVFTNCWRGTDGNVYADTDRGFEEVVSYRNGRRERFYVEPETGILRKAPLMKPYRRYVDPFADRTPTIKITETSQYAKREGIWYFESFVLTHVREVVSLATSTKPPVYREYDTKDNRAKRQLNKKELRRLGVKNG